MTVPRANQGGVKCQTVACAREAVLRCYWPGRAIDLCEPCAARARSIADAMGFQLPVLPLFLASAGDEPPHCTCDDLERAASTHAPDCPLADEEPTP